MEQPFLEFCATERKILNRLTEISQPISYLSKPSGPRVVGRRSALPMGSQDAEGLIDKGFEKGLVFYSPFFHHLGL